MFSQYKTLFIAGTDTGIGKTHTCLDLAKQLLKRGQNIKIAYFKPMQTGCTQKDINGNWIAPDEEFIKINCPEIFTKCLYTYELPATPELCAKELNEKISFELIKKELNELEKSFDYILIEGAGGLIVPIQNGKTIADLIKFLDIPTLLVSANRLGTINQTCLSIHYAKSMNLNLIGFTFSGLEADEETHLKVKESNIDFIEKYGNLNFIKV